MKEFHGKPLTSMEFPLKHGRNELQVPGGPFGLHFGFKLKVPTLWTNGVIEDREKTLIVYLANHGETVPAGAGYIGPALCSGDSIVMHAYYLAE